MIKNYLFRMKNNDLKIVHMTEEDFYAKVKGFGARDVTLWTSDHEYIRKDDIAHVVGVVVSF